MITTWPQFHRQVRRRQDRLLATLDRYPDSILVTGCQRSGTTMLARLFTGTEGMVNYWFGRDDELDAALVLSGRHEEMPRGRYCFQTTYLNENVGEYFEHAGHRIVWVLRNPHSVVYSMLYNWGKFGSRFALNELFDAVGQPHASEPERRRLAWLGRLAVSPLHRACYAYVGKVSQLFRLAGEPLDNRLIVVEYDELVRRKEALLPWLYEQVGLPWKGEYADSVRGGSVDKASRLTPGEREAIDRICLPTYERARACVTSPAA